MNETSAPVTADAVVLAKGDSVATALRDLSAGEVVQVRCGAQCWSIELQDAVGFGHKFALRAIPAGEGVLKYGSFIGRATVQIPVGCHVHVHNLTSGRARSGGV
jgi:altronate dehydratase small subunit